MTKTTINSLIRLGHLGQDLVQSKKIWIDQLCVTKLDSYCNEGSSCRVLVLNQQRFDG